MYSIKLKYIKCIRSDASMNQCRRLGLQSYIDERRIIPFAVIGGCGIFGPWLTTFWENWTSTQPAASRPSSIAPAPNGVHLCSGRTHGPHTESPQSPTARRGVSAGLSLIDSLSKKGISSLLVPLFVVQSDFHP